MRLCLHLRCGSSHVCLLVLALLYLRLRCSCEPVFMDSNRAWEQGASQSTAFLSGAKLCLQTGWSRVSVKRGPDGCGWRMRMADGKMRMEKCGRQNKIKNK